MRRLLNQLIPFFLIGIALVAFSLGILLLAYLFLLGAIVGFILFSISWIRHQFFAPKTPTKRHPSSKSHIIDTNDWKEL